MKLGKDSALEKLRTSKDKLIQLLKDNSNTWDDFDDKEANELFYVFEKDKSVYKKCS
jgi:hypothetical protein